MRARLVIAAVLLACGVLTAACSSEPAPPDLSRVRPSAGFDVEFVVGDLVGPTQFVELNEQRLLVATINGGEDDMQGQVLDIRLDEGERYVLADRLDKPTGLAVLGRDVWIMERNRLSLEIGGLNRVQNLADGRALVILDDLPNNGRSEGTITVTPDGQLLFNTSGSKRGANVVDGSGRLFTLDANDILTRLEPDEWQDAPVEIASGFKHAYAHAFDGDVLWTTEMTDGRFDGDPAGDEIVAVQRDTDHGWPRCVEDNRVVEEFGGTAEECVETSASLAIFDPGASPTSVVVSPFEPNTLLVALWNDNRVVAVDTTSNDPSNYTDFVTGLSGPQHLVVSGDSVLLTEFGEGRILRITKSSAG